MNVSDETQILHPALSSTDTQPEMRQKIVQILSGTANACLSELGYSPGMPERLKELEHQNEQWRLENMKLYQDNASLLELIHQRNERIREMHAPDLQKNIKIMELDAELQKMRVQRDELAKAQSINRSPSQLQLNFIQLQGDYVKVINGYRAKCAEVERLQSQLENLAVYKLSSKPQLQGPQSQAQHYPQHQPQQQCQQQSRPQVQQQLQPQSLHQPQPVHPQSNRPAQPRSTPTLLPSHIQNYVQLPHHQPIPATSRLQPGQQRNTQSPLASGQGQEPKNPLLQTQQAVLEQRCQAILQSQQHRSQQSSGSIPGPSTRSGQDSFVNTANHQQHPPLPRSGPSSSPKLPHLNRFHAAQSISPVALTMPKPPFATQSRASFSNNSGLPTPVTPSRSLSEQIFAPPDFNLDPSQTAMPSSNRVSSTSFDLLQPNTLTSVPATISPQDTYLKQVNQVRSPEEKDVQSFDTDTTSAETSISPVDIALGHPAFIPHHINSLKRDSSTRSEDNHNPAEQLQKKLRLEEPQLELTTIEPIADGMADGTQMDIDEDDDIVEVGPDGLRLVKDCISDLFGEESDSERERYCKLCIARRNMGYSTDSLKPFVNATNDELQEHCMTEHTEAWDTLRQSV